MYAIERQLKLDPLCYVLYTLGYAGICGVFDAPVLSGSGLCIVHASPPQCHVVVEAAASALFSSSFLQATAKRNN